MSTTSTPMTPRMLLADALGRLSDELDVGFDVLDLTFSAEEVHIEQYTAFVEVLIAVLHDRREHPAE